MRTPGDWYALGHTIFQDVLSALARYGVRPHPELRFVHADAPTPFYEPATQTIGFGVPDPATPAGRLSLYMVQHLVGAADLVETQAAMETPLPWSIAHEVAHHLRHHFGAPIANNFVEEQVVNCVAIALLSEQPEYRSGLLDLKRWADLVYERTRALSPETAPFLAGFRLDVGEVLVAQRVVPRSALSEARRLADGTGVTVEEVLLRTRQVTAAQVAHACTERATAEAYFNRRYMAGLGEYWLFGTEWLARYLERDDLPTLGEALARYILTADWEASRREATRLFLEQTVRSTEVELAVAAVMALSECDGEFPVASLVAALMDPRPPVQAAALRALADLPGGAQAGAGRAKLLLRGDDAVRGLAARLLRRAGQLVAIPGAASPAQRAETALARFRDDPNETYATLGDLLGAGPAAAAAALHALGEVGAGPLVERVATFLPAESATVRAVAVRALSGRADMARLIVERLDDPDPAVRHAARGAVSRFDHDAWAALAALLPSMPEVVQVEVLGLVDHAVMPEAPRLLTELAESVLARARRLARLETRGAGTIGLGILTQAAGEERRRLARGALRAIGRVVDPTSLAIAERALTSADPEHWTGGRNLVRAAMGRHGRALAELLASGVPEVRPARVDLVLKGYSRAEPELLRALTARVAPELLAPATARALLKRLSTDPESLVRAAAEAGLRRFAPTAEAVMLTTIEKLMFLRLVPTFAGCDIDLLRRVAEQCVVVQFEAAEEILREGEPGRHFYVVTEGRVVVTAGGRRIDELGPRQYLGEMALFDGRPRSATATAVVETTLLRLDRDDFFRLGREAPDLLIGVIRVLSERLRAQMARGDREGPSAANVAQSESTVG